MGRVSKCHGLTVVQPRHIFLSLRKILRIVIAFFFCILMSFCSFSFLILIYYVFLGVIFARFLAQNFKTKVLTAQKNQILECLQRLYLKMHALARIYFVMPSLKLVG